MTEPPIGAAKATRGARSYRRTRQRAPVEGGLNDSRSIDEVREFSTFTKELEAMKRWLMEAGCTHVVMESTGSYWKPVVNILEDDLTVCLVNPEDVKGRKGHKAD